MAKVITIVEHEELPVIAKCAPDECAITSREADKLTKIKALPSTAYSRQHNSIKWTQFCGVLHIGDLTLEILPKIHGKENDPESCRFALVKMLRAAGFMRLHRVGAASMNLQKLTVLDVFIQDLCEQLEKELLQGKIRKYITHEENLPVLRGRLLGNYQLRYNLAHKERLYCQFDELSEDIPVNQVIKLALARLMPLAQHRRVKSHLIRMLYAFDGVADISPTVARNIDRKFNRIEERYENIYRICQQIIQSSYQDVVAGKEQSFSLLFDMNRLFESWVASVFKPVAKEANLVAREQEPTRNLVYRYDTGKEIFQLRPDICLLDGKEVVLIADTKWKLLDKSESKLGISEADLYQMQAYASRYKVNQLLLIYPAQAGLKDVYDFKYISTDNLLLTVMTIDVDKPANAKDQIKHALTHLDTGSLIFA